MEVSASIWKALLPRACSNDKQLLVMGPNPIAITTSKDAAMRETPDESM
jgi:hypothetical protein